MPGAARPRTLPRRWREALARPALHLPVLLAVLCLNGALLVRYHDQFWWPPDEGNYAHVAERILDGEVLHADVQDVHPGYVNFMNAGAMAVFGRELVSMRFPLVLLGVAQAGLVFALLRSMGLVAAAVGATAITAFGFVQFLDPTAHWYALFLMILLASVLQLVPQRAWWRTDAVGAIVATAILFRQLSGIFLAMGAIAYLLLEAAPPTASHQGRDATRHPGATGGGSPWLARALVAVMVAGLAGYLVRATDEVGWAFFGIWPVLVLLWVAFTACTSQRATLAMVARLARGGAVATLPLVAYHSAHGSMGAWYRDAVETAVALPRMPFFDTASYAAQLATALTSVASGEPVAMVNGALWAVLPFVAAVVGVLVLRQLVAHAVKGSPAPAAFPVLAVFYAVVSVHYQIPIYLTYTVGASLVALLCVTRGARAVVLGLAVMAPVALYFHAGQPLSRGIAGTVAGVRIPTLVDGTLPRTGLRIEPGDAALYASLIALIHREVPPGAPIFAVPSRAELYFIADRPNPFRFFNTALGVRTPGELQAVLAELRRDPPHLVLHDARDKYNTAQSAAIMREVHATYEPLASIGPFAIFRRPRGDRRGLGR